jgi:hypothetical protein
MSLIHQKRKEERNVTCVTVTKVVIKSKIPYKDTRYALDIDSNIDPDADAA